LEGADGIFNFLSRDRANITAFGKFDLDNIFEDIRELGYGGAIRWSVCYDYGFDSSIETTKNGIGEHGVSTDEARADEN
jgi:sugar phosphate isomerase/epimerase